MNRDRRHLSEVTRRFPGSAEAATMFTNVDHNRHSSLFGATGSTADGKQNARGVLLGRFRVPERSWQLLVPSV